MSDLQILIAFTLMDAGCIYAVIKSHGEEVGLAVFAMCVTFFLVITWLIMIFTG